VFYIAPTCFGPTGPPSGSTYQNLTKVTTITVSIKISVKTLRFVLIKMHGGQQFKKKIGKIMYIQPDWPQTAINYGACALRAG
jgi:hypothetical protein